MVTRLVEVERCLKHPNGHAYCYACIEEYYVYELLDPRVEPPAVFYVGKGSNGRIDAHEKDAKKLAYAGDSRSHFRHNKPRHKIIRGILAANKQVVKRKVDVFDNSDAALRRERDLHVSYWNGGAGVATWH